VGGLIARRLAHGLVVLWGVSVVVFLVLRVVPGDPVLIMFPEGLSPQQLRAEHAALGLDRPLLVQYGAFVSRALHGDLGDSFRYERPALGLVLQRFPATAQLAAVAMAITILVGIPLGLVAAAQRGGWIDRTVMLTASLGQSLPTFWLGIMLIVIFAVALHWLPTSGRGSLAQLVLPAVTLAGYSTALTARLTRAGMLDVFAEPYIRTARAKGLREITVLIRHVLRNGLIPVVTLLGLQVGTLLGGAVITEAVFAWPGVGLLAVSAVFTRDYNVVQAVVLLSTVIFIVVNLCIDLCYVVLDPRIRLG